jgi:hypothetical protein
LEGFEESHLFYFEMIVRFWEKKAKISMILLSLHQFVWEEEKEFQMKVRKKGSLRVSGGVTKEASHCSWESLNSHCNDQVWHGK